MTFWSIYCPVFAALLSFFVVMEAFHFGLGYYIQIKQQKAQKELEAKIASGEIDPMSMFGGLPGMPSFGSGLPTASGSDSVDKVEASLGHGQYL